MTPFLYNDLRIIQLNCHSIANKTSEIKLKLYTRKPHIMALSETWITNLEPRFIDYKAIWKHRQGVGGGLGLLLRRGIQYQILHLNHYNNGKLEYQAINIFMKDTYQLSILSIYNPNENITPAEIMFYVQQLGTKFMIIGDMNAHTSMLNPRDIRTNATGRTLEYITMNEGLCLINPVSFYTYLNAATGVRSCLDICMTSANIAPGITMQQLDDVGSDHLPILITLQLEPAFNEVSRRKTWKITKEGLNKLSNNIQPSNLSRPNNINEINRDITERIITAAGVSMHRSSGRMAARKNTTWWDEECTVAVAECRQARRKLEAHPLPQNR